MGFKKSLGALSAALFIGSACGLALAAGADWAYQGENGPENWANLSPDYEACAGGQQSPIDLTGGMKAALPPMSITVGYLTGDITTAHKSVKLTAGLEGALEIGDTSYDLLQMYFHASSEHTIDGQAAPLVAHYVYQSGDQLAVIGVMFTAGEKNLEFDRFLSAAPDGDGSQAIENISMNALMPNDMSDYFRYQGSLTTPPCTEIVLWTVMNNPVEVSQEQIDEYTARFGGTARPVQQLNRRYILKSF